MEHSLENLIVQLNDFDYTKRKNALNNIVSKRLVAFPASGINVNMHFHSFFSYNAEDYSPSRIAFEAKRSALYAAGLCDFDVLDGLEEFFYAGLLLKLRTTVNMETRAYLREFSDVDINSPGEPGVTYIMGAAFPFIPSPESQEAKELSLYKERAKSRNIALIERINPYMDDVAISYEDDVLPLTPSGNATERHIVKAYIHKAICLFETPDKVAEFWSERLGKKSEEIIEIMTDKPLFEETVRARLVKKGGIGYQQPSPTTFPPVDDFIRVIKKGNAIPMITWLDGTSRGEENAAEMLECLVAKGCCALNIIPDRNWNISDPARKKIKMEKLREIVQEASKRYLPINIGTEMNKQGLPFTDNLSCEALLPYRDVFLEGAKVMVGHTLLTKYAGFTYTGDAASSEFPDKSKRNKFFAAVGALPPIDLSIDSYLKEIGKERAMKWFYDMVKKQTN